jgi:hypothetical protein
MLFMNNSPLIIWRNGDPRTAEVEDARERVAGLEG